MLRSKFMKIIALNGSPRKALSRTGQIIGEILMGTELYWEQTEYIDITTLAIGGCIGCYRCHHLGVCIQKDDFNVLFDKICASDGIVLGSPVYIYQVTAQLKAFIDRLGHAIHCQRLLGKYGAVVATAGGSGQVETANYLHLLLNRLGVQCVGRIACTLDDGPVAGGSLIMQQADKLGLDLVRAIVEKHQFPDQIQTIEGMRQYFRSIMIKHKGRWDWEYRYWQDKGWLE